MHPIQFLCVKQLTTANNIFHSKLIKYPLKHEQKVIFLLDFAL
jgi:hypothetical protein